MYSLERTQQLNCTLPEAWRFFSSPHNLSGITPPDMNFVVLSELNDGEFYEGMIIDYKVSPLLNWPLQWRTVITQVQELKSFIDFQQKGPYQYWEHFHEFTPNENGVLMKDLVKYELPFGFLGSWMHRLVVRKKLHDIFDYRYRVLEKLFNKK
ncbi:SRPBCC family protein [Niabella hibiscisoli]|uniref:SRPBCC family protein n=1 Tax=Niabella hibiscisoli TaxID=1825928 RepID=UPI001F0E443A|nr:SRPBCC family protein [Niabella hibiscisoli]MCH5718601.1 SRPBCC family protein [Niabella hibiscisoli]